MSSVSYSADMTAEEFRRKYPENIRNHNCLRDIACGNCGSRGGFLISGEAVFAMFDDGTSEFEDVQYESCSRAACRGCGRVGTVEDFTIRGLDS